MVKVWGVAGEAAAEEAGAEEAGASCFPPEKANPATNKKIAKTPINFFIKNSLLKDVKNYTGYVSE